MSSSKDDLRVELWTLDKDSHRVIFAAIFIQDIWSDFLNLRVYIYFQKFSDKNYVPSSPPTRSTCLDYHPIIYYEALLAKSGTLPILRQIGPLQIGPLEILVQQIGSRQIALGQIGPRQNGPRQIGPQQIGHTWTKCQIKKNCSFNFLHCAPQTSSNWYIHIYFLELLAEHIQQQNIFIFSNVYICIGYILPTMMLCLCSED